ncbi:putative F-box protein At1g67623 [Magnolia sinica]|uniref:putative F-box protein At1g67623 n=1 Tax=Magnolia sinica TaxID=86752 RepID=UPI002659AF82|nr:putative F-box protein At1g67623 [Magnolia sinica]
MGLSKVMKRRQQQCSFFKSLPQDLVVEIVASVSASSLSDLSNMKLLCKDMHEAATDNYVFRHASIEALLTIEWRISSQASSFLKQCEASGNPDALFRRGMIEYFSKVHIEFGVDLLKKAADCGHLEANYVLGIILISGQTSTSVGMKLLKKLENMKNTEAHRCQTRTKKILREIWINAIIPRRESTCIDPNCKNGGLRGLPRVGEWSWSDQEESFCSQVCKWNYELNLFCTALIGV